MKARRTLDLIALALSLGCVGDKSPTAPAARPNAPEAPSQVIADGAHGGNPDFWFLPPMVPLPIGNPNFKLGTFTNALKPSLSVVVCELIVPSGLPTPGSQCTASPVKTFPQGTVQLVNLPLRQNGWWSLFNLPADGFYYVLWDTRQSNLSVNKYYRIKVFVDGKTDPLGYADVDPMSSLLQWKYTLTNQVIQLVDGVMLPIPFRVEQGALCYQSAQCASVTVTNNSPTPQLVPFDAGAGVVAGVEIPSGAWLPPTGPQSVLLTIRQVPSTETDNVSHARAVPCHANLPLYQQFDGCFSFTTTPALLPYPPTGHQFLQKLRVAVCYVLQDSHDPREKFAELYASGPNEPAHPLEDVSDAGILGADSRNCPAPAPVITLANHNSLTQVASAGWEKLKHGFGRVFGVNTAYGVDLGLGGYVTDFSNIGPVLPASINAFTFESFTLGPNQVSSISKVQIRGNHSHSGDGVFAGVDSVPVTFSVVGNNGTIRAANSEGSFGTAPVTVNTATEGGDVPIDGIAAVSWTPPDVPGTYTMTASGPATGGPIVFTVTVPVRAAFQAWVGGAAGQSAGPVTFGGPPFCLYTVQFTNMNVALNLNTTGGGTAGVTGTQVEQLATPPCGDIQPAPPHNDQYTSTSVTRNGSQISATLVPVGNFIAASLTFSGTMSTDEQSVSGTLTWHRTDQGPPLDWTVVAPITLLRNAPVGISNPSLAFVGSEFYSTGPGLNFVRYKLSVTNYDVYPADMFARRADLPPCGLTAAASRTWVDIYNAATNARIYGFCGLGAPSDMQSIWFAEPVGTAPPAQVYIKMTDRATGITYTSNNVTPLPPP